jgi:hypothetical protein
MCKESAQVMIESAKSQLQSQVASLASAAGLEIVSSAEATSFAGAPNTQFQLALTGQSARQTQLELSDAFASGRPEFAQQLKSFFSETAQRLRNPVPNALLTLGGIPLMTSSFRWPFHESTAGADTSLVHGEVHLADGTATPLFAKIAASMTVTFREIVAAPEQPFAESFILNAVRKTFDQGQLDLVKSGNRQPVPVTTRYYSSRTQKFVFNDTTEPQRKTYLAAKAFWLSGVLGAESPIWMLDPRDAQYLNATVADLKVSLEALAREGVVALEKDPAYASPTPALMARRPEFEAHLAEALAFIKPSFNEEMRGGHTNM